MVEMIYPGIDKKDLCRQLEAIQTKLAELEKAERLAVEKAERERIAAAEAETRRRRVEELAYIEANALGPKRPSDGMTLASGVKLVAESFTCLAFFDLEETELEIGRFATIEESLLALKEFRKRLRHDAKHCVRIESSRKGTSSKYIGVSYQKQKKKWRVYCTILGKSRYVGIYDTEDMAAHAYNHVASKAFGKFAILNKL